MIFRTAQSLCFLWAVLAASLAFCQDITDAYYTEPTSRYDHAILGDAIEWGGLRLKMSRGADIQITLPKARVFEDLNPRLADLDRDGRSEVITVETDLSLGARLAIYNERGLMAATPFIGRTHRWLAPVGFGDFDQDGLIEIAYVDRPHLAKTLRIWRLNNKKLTHLQDIPGLTNHKIGWDFVLGGVKNCNNRKPEIILSDATWSKAMRISHDGAKFIQEKIAPLNKESDLDSYLICP